MPFIDYEQYEDAVSYIEAIPRFSGRSTKALTRSFYEYIDFHTDAKIFHVAGTNGKGSVCAFLVSMHRSMDKQVAAFISPHLVDIRERIIVNDSIIDKDEFLDAFNKTKKCLEDFQKTSDERADYHPAYFEFLFFLFLIYNQYHPMDAIVLETGIGGNLDCTNLIYRKDVCAITEIGLDHCEQLGDTIEKIASDKVGIIREGVPVVFADRGNGATDVILERAESLNCPTFAIGPKDVQIGREKIAFSYDSRYYKSVYFEVNSSAAYQAENASVALRTIECCYEQDELPLQAMSEGIRNMFWPGRMEQVLDGVYIDGAHNVDGIKAFVDSVKTIECKGKRHLLFSAVDDKQSDIMVNILVESGLFSHYATGHIDSYRGIEVNKLADLFGGVDCVEVYDSIEDAYRSLYDSMEKGDLLFVCGSLYMVGQLKGRVLGKAVD